MKNLDAMDTVDECIGRLEFLIDAFRTGIELSDKGANGLVFILRDIIDHLEEASEMEKGNKKIERVQEEENEVIQ